MKKHLTQRQKDERTRRMAMPIALIVRPLKRIKAHCGPSMYSLAYELARSGDGAAVQSMARSHTL